MISFVCQVRNSVVVEHLVQEFQDKSSMQEFSNSVMSPQRREDDPSGTKRSFLTPVMHFHTKTLFEIKTLLRFDERFAVNLNIKIK